MVCKTFSVSKEELDEYIKKDINKFIETGKYSYLAHHLFQDMCNKGIIEPGNYLINVYW